MPLPRSNTCWFCLWPQTCWKTVPKRPETAIPPRFLLEGDRMKCSVNSTEDKHAHHVCERCLSPTYENLPLLLLPFFFLLVEGSSICLYCICLESEPSFLTYIVTVAPNSALYLSPLNITSPTQWSFP